MYLLLPPEKTLFIRQQRETRRSRSVGRKREMTTSFLRSGSHVVVMNAPHALTVALLTVVLCASAGLVTVAAGDSGGWSTGASAEKHGGGIAAADTASVTDEASRLDTTVGTDLLAASVTGLQGSGPIRSTYVSPPRGEVTREEYTTGGFDLAASAAADAEALRGSYREQVFTERFEAAQDREAVLERFLTNLTGRLDELDGTHAELIAQFGAGERSPTALLRGLIRTTAATRAEAGLADTIESATAEAGVGLPGSFEDIAVTSQREIPALESPVTEAIASGQVGPGRSVYAQATSDALVLAVAGDTHIRQATLRGERDPSGDNQFAQQEGSANVNALERADILYADAVGYNFGPPVGGATDVYRLFNGDSGFGTFRAYIDGATTNVFHEIHTVDSPAALEAVGTNVSNATGADGGLELTVETTEPTGPMLVSVTDGGQPVGAARLAVDSQFVGTTDADGEHWVTQPLGTFEVRATVGNETVTVEGS